MAAQEFRLKDVAALPTAPGDKQEVEVEGIEGGKVLLVNAGGKVQAIGSKCTHYGAPLIKGVLTTTGRLTCPWHGACFNAKTGDVEDAPALDALPTFAVTQRDGAFYITGEESTIKTGRRKPKARISGGAAATNQEERVVIVGGGSAGHGVVEGLRERGYAGAITIISKEGYLPVDRPKLSKALIPDPSKLALRGKEWFDEAAIEWIEDEVTGVDFSDRFVTTKDGKKLKYTKLVLATGGTPRRLPLQGFTVLDNIFTMRSVHDVKNIVDAIGDKGKNIVVIGSSFIGLEFAGATAKDNKVTVVGRENLPLSRVLGEKVGAGLKTFLESKGINFKLGADIDRAEPSVADPSKVGAVFLKDGTKLDADLVILGVGVSPATEFLRENKVLQLEKDGSLVTDENYSVVGLKDVYAAGDIATAPYHGPGGEGKNVRIEHWNVAQNSGRQVAGHIFNPAVASEHFIPVFWSALGAQLRYCGNTANGWDDSILDGNPAEGQFVIYYTKGETVVAMASMGRDPLMVQSAELMRRGKMPTKSQLAQNADVLAVGPPE